MLCPYLYIYRNMVVRIVYITNIKSIPIKYIDLFALYTKIPNTNCRFKSFFSLYAKDKLMEKHAVKGKWIKYINALFKAVCESERGGWGKKTKNII